MPHHYAIKQKDLFIWTPKGEMRQNSAYQVSTRIKKRTMTKSSEGDLSRDDHLETLIGWQRKQLLAPSGQHLL